VELVYIVHGDGIAPVELVQIVHGDDLFVGHIHADEEVCSMTVLSGPLHRLWHMCVFFFAGKSESFIQLEQHRIAQPEC
jgi:hypothetical protein